VTDIGYSYVLLWCHTCDKSQN